MPSHGLFNLIFLFWVPFWRAWQAYLQLQINVVHVSMNGHVCSRVSLNHLHVQKF